ncbi:SLC25A29 [Symbiodinium necroappetens]|uniref:SLC25A29 protein n=1 Tax=Symbiodinium necroappetens TaxID=1628268 RepID=A0A812YXW5_9DINO|nr:SLC25A29 [Symbiodinium necroappetens]
MVAILAGHPLDTAKTRIQAMPRFDGYGTWRVLAETARLEGPLALYKGMSFPFYSTALLTAVVFGVQGVSDRLLQGQRRRGPMEERGAKEYCLLELKCLGEAAAAESEGPGIRPRLPARNAHRITASKSCVEYGVYFLVYEESKRLLDPRAPAVLSTLFSGGMAGCFALGMIHPVDVVKARVQSLPAQATAEQRSTRHIIAEGLRNEGAAFFLRGFSAAMQRAFVVNAATFGGVELGVALWDRMSAKGTAVA